MAAGKHPGGRPSKAPAEKRSEEVKFRVTPDVKRRLQDEAKAAGVDLAAYCREKVLTGQPPRRVPPEALAALAELARQGNNLNQLARIANSEKNMAPVALRLVRLLDLYEELTGKIRGCFSGGARGVPSRRRQRPDAEPAANAGRQRMPGGPVERSAPSGKKGNDDDR